MDVFHPKMLTRIALIYLEEAVLDVLFKANKEGGLEPKKIAGLIGISSSYKTDSDANPIVHGILNGLESRGLVQQKKPYDPWGLTVKGIETQLAKYHANIR